MKFDDLGEFKVRFFRYEFRIDYIGTLFETRRRFVCGCGGLITSDMLREQLACERCDCRFDLAKVYEAIS